MKQRTCKYVKYCAVIAAGISLMAQPMTAMADKAEETAVAAAEDTVKTETADKTAENTKSESAEKTEDAAEPESTEKSTEDAAKDDASEEENTSDKTDAEADTETELETDAAAEAETEAETKTEPETETAAGLKAEDELASAIIGIWAADKSTGFSFEEDSKGKLILTDEDYAFSYEIDEDQLKLDFVSSKVGDSTYTVSVSGDTLTLIGGKGTIGGTFELSRKK